MPSSRRKRPRQILVVGGVAAEHELDDILDRDGRPSTGKMGNVRGAYQRRGTK
jgi:hypothetical protein